ncbi:unnamed protein product [Fusarium graminearum]|nr:hypothetical protein HG531_012626 [Fusarium graminearum]CAF3478898.1 unnamed protein product [Fusarium graminearum]CAG1963280.1 unnamed protein product [Fusarium graminearum]CAG2005594.1 unnamed protein product [Fusarium graminearum]VTO84723.1 unnamed protein product [Fusarium graminearum]
MSIFEQDDKTCRAIADACAGSTNRPSNQPVELRFSRTTDTCGFPWSSNWRIPSLVKVAEDILLQLCCEVWTFDDDYTQSYPASQDIAKNTGKQKTSRTLRETPRSDSRVTSPNMNNSLLRLPAELQIMILQHLTFGQVEALRRTCRSLRYNVSKPVIRFIFPSLKFELLSTCYRCLAHDPERDTLIKADESDARYPLANECIDCVASRGGFSIGRTYTLASRSTVCVCRYCGFPVTSDAAWKEYEFHRKCYRRYHMASLSTETVEVSPYAQQSGYFCDILDVPAEHRAEVSGEMVQEKVTASIKTDMRMNQRKRQIECGS